MDFKNIKDNRVLNIDLFFTIIISSELNKIYGEENCSYENGEKYVIIKIKFQTYNTPFSLDYHDTLIIIVDKEKFEITKYRFENILYCQFQAPYISEIIKIFKIFKRYQINISCDKFHYAICDINTSIDYEILKSIKDYTFLCIDNYTYYENADMLNTENIRLIVNDRFLIPQKNKLILCDIDKSVMLAEIENSINYTNELCFNSENIHEHTLYSFKIK